MRQAEFRIQGPGTFGPNLVTATSTDIHTQIKVRLPVAHGAYRTVHISGLVQVMVILGGAFVAPLSHLVCVFGVDRGQAKGPLVQFTRARGFGATCNRGYLGVASAHARAQGHRAFPFRAVSIFKSDELKQGESRGENQGLGGRGRSGNEEYG